MNAQEIESYLAGEYKPFQTIPPSGVPYIAKPRFAPVESMPSLASRRVVGDQVVYVRSMSPCQRLCGEWYDVFYFVAPAVKELTELRDRYGGCNPDRRAINRHSVRYYQAGKVFFVLDRTLDASPRFFTLYRMPGDPRDSSAQGICQRVKVYSKDDWGNDLPWTRAVPLAIPAMEQVAGHAQ